MAHLTSALVLVALLPFLANALLGSTACYFGAQQQILQPAASTNITQQYPSGKVPFQYCVPNYKSFESLNITVFLASATDENPAKDGVIVGQSTNTGSAGSTGYDITLTIPKGTKPAANSQLFVLEWGTSAYIFPSNVTDTFSQAVKF